MKELSIFVDESGDFGSYEKHSPFYFFTLVFHEQDKAITSQIEFIDRHIRELELPEKHCFHAGPIIRSEEEYRNFNIKERRKCLNAITSFARNVDIAYQTFFVEKKIVQDSFHLNSALSKQLFDFLIKNQGYFNAFNKIIVYYDNGQGELSKILTSIFSVVFTNVEFRKVLPVDYKLFQVADLICTMELVKTKYDRDMQSASEKGIFGSKRDFNKNYLKPLSKLKFNEKHK